jgi:hypothetical protein
LTFFFRTPGRFPGEKKTLPIGAFLGKTKKQRFGGETPRGTNGSGAKKQIGKLGQLVQKRCLDEKTKEKHNPGEKNIKHTVARGQKTRRTRAPEGESKMRKTIENVRTQTGNKYKTRLLN